MAETVKDNPGKVEFTMLRGGKGYVVAEVDAYVETIRGAYSELEQELNKISLDREKCAADLSAAQESHRQMQSQMQNRIFEMSGNIEDAGLKLTQAAKEYESLLEEKKQTVNLADELIKKLEDAEQLAEQNQNACSAMEKRALEAEGELASQTEGSPEKLEELQEELAQVNEQFEQVRNENESLRRQVSEHEKKIQEQEKHTEMIMEQADSQNVQLQQEYSRLMEDIREKDEELQRLQEYQDENADEAEYGLSAVAVSNGYADQYVSILEVVRTAADRYAYEMEKRMSTLLEEAQTNAAEQQSHAKREAEELVRTAREESEDILRNAKADADGIAQEAGIKAEIIQKKADETLQAAEQRATETLSRARQELSEVRSLIERASAEYQALCAEKAQETEVL